MGKHDPPAKAQLIAKFRRTPSTIELMVAAAEAQFPPKTQQEDGASRATPMDELKLPPNRGRKRVVTPDRIRMICELLASGKTELAACIRAGIGNTAWSAAKRVDSALREQIASAKDDWARLRSAQHAAALYESQVARSAGRKVLKPHPTKQANMVFWHLVKRVPLNFVAIPENEIRAACERFSISTETWRRQERAFGLLRKVYARRAAIRGQQQSPVAPVWTQQVQYWPSDSLGDES